MENLRAIIRVMNDSIFTAMTRLLILLLSLAIFCARPAFAAPAVNDLGSRPCDALKNATILVIRHAEKPDSGFELAPAGYARAKAYVDYFSHFQIDGQPLKLDHIFCTADSKGSHRPRLTITPLSEALKLPPDARFANKDVEKLTGEIRGHSHGSEMLICWHHGEIPEVLDGLGADPKKLLPHGKWPDDMFSWLVELRYDADGRLQDVKVIPEKLMPGDPAADSHA